MGTTSRSVLVDHCVFTVFTPFSLFFTRFILHFPLILRISGGNFWSYYIGTAESPFSLSNLPGGGVWEGGTEVPHRDRARLLEGPGELYRLRNAVQ